MSADSDSSSSDFSSDEENDAAIVAPSYASSLTPRVVQVEIVEDEEMATLDAAALDDPELSAEELLAPLRDGAVPEQLLQALEPLLATQSYSYDAYSTALYYVASLWPHDASAASQRALHKARAAVYKRFHTAFPLTPEMYEEYVSDVESTPAKLRLYEQAMRDYWSVPLSLQYLQLLAENEGVVPGLTWLKLLERMEFLLSTVGHHYTQGADVWKLCRELTTQHFDEQEATADEDLDLAKERALRDLFTRQMRLPLQQNDLVMSEFRAWNQYNTLQDATTRQHAIEEAEEFQQRKFVAGGVFKKMNQYEARLTAALSGTVSVSQAQEQGEDQEPDTPERVWAQYLQYVQSKVVSLMSSKDEAHRYVVCTMERSVASVCLSAKLWRKYVLYAQTSSMKAQDVTAVCQRATRNVSFDSFAWVEWLLAIEATEDFVAEINAAVESALLSRTSPPLMDSAHMTRVLTNYCGLVRRVSGDTDATLDAAISRCQDFTQTAFPAQEAASMAAALLQLQAQYYAFRSQSAKWWKIWQEILRIRGSEAEAWLTMYEEFRFVHHSQSWAALASELREKVFKPAVDQVRDYPLVILEKWLQFEMTAGDRDDYKHVKQAYDKLQNQLTRLQYQGQTTAAPAAPVAVAFERPVAAASKKRKAETSAPQSAPTKRSKAQEIVKEAKPKAERFTNENTLFVCNMSKETTADELRAIFAHIPTLRDVRLVAKERGSHVKSRGMAYVQFSDDAGVVAGLLVNGTELQGQTIKVERSIPPKEKAEKASGGGKAAGATASKATTTLYVGGLLPPDRDPITEDQVKTALAQVLAAGDDAVKQVLILTDKRGRPKDYGLVQVAEPKLVEQAIGKQAELKHKLGDQVTVQPSRMTIVQVVRHRDEQKQESLKAKQAKQVKQPPPAKAEAAFQAKTAPHKKPNTRLMVPKAALSAASLMPRALRKKTVATTETTEAASPPVSKSTADGSAAGATATGDLSSAPKTNADFRKLFMS